MKTFRNDLALFRKMLYKKEPFAFTRFSDGELRILQNKKLVIGQNNAFVNGQWHVGNWGKEEHKTFDPDRDSLFREKLIKSFIHKQQNYYKGICCKCCVGQDDWKWQFENFITSDEPYLTWANLFLNKNYKEYYETLVPIFKNYSVVYVCNENASFNKLPFKVEKDFRIGNDCTVKNIDLIEEMKKWALDKKPEGMLFLFSAASLSNLLIYQLYKEFPNNTYLDIGSTLNPILDLNGWIASRGYLRGYWLNQPDSYSDRECIW